MFSFFLPNTQKAALQSAWHRTEPIISLTVAVFFYYFPTGNLSRPVYPIDANLMYHTDTFAVHLCLFSAHLPSTRKPLKPFQLLIATQLTHSLTKTAVNHTWHELPTTTLLPVHTFKIPPHHHHREGSLRSRSMLGVRAPVHYLFDQVPAQVGVSRAEPSKARPEPAAVKTSEGRPERHSLPVQK